MKRNGETKGIKETKFRHGIITLCLMTVIMFYLVVVCGASPHIPLILGCVIAGIMAKYLGYTWESILEGMLKGIIPSLEAVIILILIGVLIATWIAAGTVPAMILYGLKNMSAKYFLVAVMVICSIIAMAVGSWGTVGTVGIAFMGISAVLQINPALTAGAIVSGSYMGEAMSPLSDATNLVSAVGRKDIFSVVKHAAGIILPAYAAAAVLYIIIGLKNAPSDTAAIDENIRPLIKCISENYDVNILTLLPMFLMVICIVAKVPAIPSILVGIISAMIQAILLQNAEMKVLIDACYNGYISNTGDKMIDTLLSAGGIVEMMYAVTIIFAAMAFGGLMQHTNQMSAVISPIINKIKGAFGMIALTSVSCITMNILLPDQYLGISVPGQMYKEPYEERGIDGLYLTDALCATATVTSPLIPWNTCGAYVSTVLGVSAVDYFAYSYFNIASIFFMIFLGGFLASRSVKKKQKN